MSKKIRNIAIPDSCLTDVRDSTSCSTPLIDYIKLILRELNVSFKDDGTCPEENCTGICPPDIAINYDSDTKILCISVGDTEECLEIDVSTTVFTENCNGVETTGTGTEEDPLKTCLVIDADPCNIISLSENGLLAVQTIVPSYEDGILSIDTGCDTTELDISGLYEFDNGLTKTGNLVQLGGPLVEDTVIDLDSNELEIAGDDIILSSFPNTRDDSGTTTPLNMLYTDIFGTLLSTPIEEILPAPYELCAENGLHIPATGEPFEGCVLLGGELIEDTELSGDYSISVTEGKLAVGYGLPLGDFKFGTNNTDTTINVAAISTNSQPAKNSMDTTSLVGTREVTGGAFTQSVIGNVYGIVGNLDLRQTGNQVLIDSNNSAIVSSLNLALSNASSLTVPVISSLTASNNALLDGDYAKVAALHVSAITTKSDTEPLFSGTIDEYSGLYIETLGTSRILGTGSITKTYGVHQVGDVSNWFKGHVTISGFSDPESAATLALYPAVTDRPRLSISKAATYTTIPEQTAGTSALIMSGGGTDTVTDEYGGFSGTLFWQYTNNQAPRYNTRFAGIIGNIIVISDFNHTQGVFSGVANNSVLAPNTAGTQGTLEHLAGFRATHPRQDEAAALAGKVFAGITNNYGVLIDDQLISEVPISSSWGVYQKGAADHNHFNASVFIGSNTVVNTLKFSVTSTTQGSLPAPRMNTTQRNAMGTSLTGGTLIYNTTDEEYQYFKTSTLSWVAL